MRAGALLNVWLLKQNGTKDPNGQLIDADAMEWENAFIQRIFADQTRPQGLTLDALAERR